MLSGIRISISHQKISRAPSSSPILWPKNAHADSLNTGSNPCPNSGMIWFRWWYIILFWNDQRWNCKLFLFGRIRAHGGDPFTEPVLSWYWWMHEFRKSMSAKSSMSKYGRLFQMYHRRSKRFKIQPWKLLSYRPVIWKFTSRNRPAFHYWAWPVYNIIRYCIYFNIDEYISDPHQTLHAHKGQKLVAMRIFAQNKELLEDEILQPLGGHGLHF